MTAFTVWRFDTPDGAASAAQVLRDAAGDGLVTVLDHAVVSWAPGADRPTAHHTHEDEKRGAGWGALWGLLLGALFFVPLLGAAAGAATGLISKHLQGVGISPDDIARVRDGLGPGTSALFAVTEDADLDRLGERFHGSHRTLVASNLTDAERSVLHETFG